MKNNGSNKWEAIAARIASERGPVDEGAPYGFATRVVARWRAARRDETLRRWSLWSLRAALCSAAVCGLVVILTANENDSPILVQPPSAEFIALPPTGP